MNNGKILIFTGIAHTLLCLSPYAFGSQFEGFARRYFFNVSEGLLEFPLLNGQMNFENFAAFWFFYFGLLLIPLGIIVNYLEKLNHQIPYSFVWFYFMLVLIGAYMIPLSGMTFLMLPHGIFMLVQKYRIN